MTEDHAIHPQIWRRRAAIGALYLLFYLVAELAALPHKPDGLPIIPWNAAPAISFGLVARLGWKWLPAVFTAPLLAAAFGGYLWTEPVTALARIIAEVVACAIAGACIRAEQVSMRASPALVLGSAT